MTAIDWRPETVVEDERNRGIPAVVRYGPYLFVAGSDGHRRLNDDAIDPALAEDAVAQCRNSYGRVAQRLKRAGYGDDAVVWVQNYTSSLHWRLERMALWPEYFGEENHLRAVSFGAQSRMHGINMITSVVMAIDPAIARHVAVPSPGRGRASRCTRVGDLTFVIGVRGHADVATGKHAPEETPAAFDVQLDYCVDALRSHLRGDGNGLENLVRVDAALRGARFVPAYERRMRDAFDGRVPYASSAIGLPLGGRCEQEVCGVAAAPEAKIARQWSRHDPSTVDSATAGRLTFVRSLSGIRDADSGALRYDLFGNVEAQVFYILESLARLLSEARTSIDRCLRFDIFLRDIYAEEQVVNALRNALRDRVPALSFIGAEPADGSELAISAIAAA